MKILIVKTGEALPKLRKTRGDFESWFSSGLGMACDHVDVCSGRMPPPPDNYGGVVVTGSAAMVSDPEPWAVFTARWLRDVVGQLPILGVCYGHQLLAYALGGAVGDNPQGRQIGTTEARLADTVDELFSGLPDLLPVQVSHRQVVLEPPPDAVILATNGADPYHALRYGPACWGVQFHPEFDAEIIRGYVDGLADRLVAEGLDIGAIRAGIRATPAAATVLDRFAGVVRGVRPVSR